MVRIEAAGAHQNAIGLGPFLWKDDFAPGLHPDVCLALDEQFQRYIAGQQNSTVSGHSSIAATHAALGDKSRTQIAENGAETEGFISGGLWGRIGILPDQQ
jgi:hypothetical protein